jgi:four helix bundle protein
MKQNVVHEKAFLFALDIIGLYRKYVEEHEYVLSKQVLRCGTSIGANLEEARAAQSRSDFYSKVAIASKEARETSYWLRLFQQSQLVEIDLTGYIEQADELVRLLTSILKTISEKS